MCSPLNLNKFLSVCICVSLFSIPAKAQKVQEFSFIQPQYKVANSLYNKISVLDLRADTTVLGIVQKGMSNKKAVLIAKQPLELQLQNMLAMLIDSSAKSNELLMVIKRLTFSELTTAFSEKGFLKFNAVLYVKQSNGYLQLALIDQTLETSAMDVTNGLLKKGSGVVSEFVANNLKLVPSSTTLYDYANIKSDNDVDKESMPVYFTEIYTDGVYKNYESFCKQIPNGSISVDKDSVGKGTVKSLRIDGKFRKVNPAEVFAIVYNGKPYIATKYGYFPLKKVDNSFTFIGKVSTATTSDITMASVAFGALGGLIASSANAVLEVKIERYSGEFLKLREILNGEYTPAN